MVVQMGNSVSLDEYIDMAITARELRAEVLSLKADNDALRRELIDIYTAASATSATSEGTRAIQPDLSSSKSFVSAAAIELFVEKLLADPTSNVAFVPDFIERPLERKMMVTMMTAIGSLLDTASIKFLGHEILLQLKPTVETVDTAETVAETAEPIHHVETAVDAIEASFDASALPLN